MRLLHLREPSALTAVREATAPIPSQLRVRLAVVALGMAQLAAGHAQSAPKDVKPLRFDVVSVKPSDQTWLQIRPERSGGRITWTTGLSHVIEYAFQLQLPPYSGPIPGDDHLYLIQATTRPDATTDEIRMMMQSMLRDRFAMETHRETKDAEGYALTVAKGGSKIRPAKDDEPTPESMNDWGAVADGTVAATLPRAGVVQLRAYRATMPQLVNALQRQLSAVVWDQTGLDGKYFIDLQYVRDVTASDVADAPTIFVAFRKTLGLELEKHKGPVEVLVVDHIASMPTEN